MKHTSTFKEKAYGSMAKLVKALASPYRLAIIDLLRNGEKSVEEIAAAIGTTLANASQHLQVLKKLSLVYARKDGTFVFYSLAAPEVEALWHNLFRLSLRHVPELKSLLRNKRRGLPLIELPLDPSRFFLLDVRPEDEFRHHHLAGAHNIPLGELGRRMHEIPRHRPVVAYCRGPFCTWADEAVYLLAENGYEAYRLKQE